MCRDLSFILTKFSLSSWFPQRKKTGNSEWIKQETPDIPTQHTGPWMGEWGIYQPVILILQIPHPHIRPKDTFNQINKAVDKDFTCWFQWVDYLSSQTTSIWVLWRPNAFILLGTPGGPSQMSAAPELHFQGHCCKFESWFLWAEIFVLPRRCAWAKRRRRGSFNKARFVQASPSLAQRERHLNKAAYQSPSTKGVAKLHNTHHLPPAAPVTEERQKKEGRDAGEEKLLRSTQISQNPNSSRLGCPDNQRRHSSTVASSSQHGLNPTRPRVWTRLGPVWSCCVHVGSLRCSTSFQRRSDVRFEELLLSVYK